MGPNSVSVGLRYGTDFMSTAWNFEVFSRFLKKKLTNPGSDYIAINA
jgi:hypothetical protein